MLQFDELDMFVLFQGKRVYYLTNNSNDTRQYYLDTCHRYGFDAIEVRLPTTGMEIQSVDFILLV